jgi:hypothetical protein
VRVTALRSCLYVFATPEDEDPLSVVPLNAVRARLLTSATPATADAAAAASAAEASTYKGRSNVFEVSVCARVRLES